MLLSTFPFKYYSVLPDYTLANKVREKSWDLDRIFPLLKKEKSELEKLAKGIKSSPSSILKVRHAIYLLTVEIKLGFKDLKYINFYDSALFYLYFRLLHHIHGLCKKEEEKLMDEAQKEISKEKSPESAKDIKKQKKELEKSISEHAKLASKLDKAKKIIVKVHEDLAQEMRKRRWDAEKQAQHEFRLLTFTMRSMENINRKIKVEAIKTKNRVVPQKADLMRKIRKKPSPDDIIQLAKLVSEGIDRISKDVYYSSKLISKFEIEMKRLEITVENLKKSVNKLFKGEKQKEKIREIIFTQWDSLIERIEKEIDKDLMQVFNNIFVLHKKIATTAY
ncbi:hypothetical protein HYX08_06560 [Candidatus Woesearchaeota archaeon]|nr:hypothetical protein [Candidatus Woesearchaeota archaeon]